MCNECQVFNFLMEMFLALCPIVYTFHNLFDLQVYFLMLTLNNTNEFLTSKLLKQGYRYHKFRTAFSKFYYRNPELRYLLKDFSATRHIRTCILIYIARILRDVSNIVQCYSIGYFLVFLWYIFVPIFVYCQMS